MRSRAFQTVFAAAAAVMLLLSGCSDSDEVVQPIGLPRVSDEPAAPGTSTESVPPVPAASVPTLPVIPGQPTQNPIPTDSGSAVADARRTLASMRVSPEFPDGYDVREFPHWSAVDGGPCDVRQFVLRLASQTPARTVIGSCEPASGKWRSAYDDRWWTDPQDVTVDHVVGLREAWESGADRWDVNSRAVFANEINRQAPQLVVVTDEVAQAKAGRDPAGWLPSENPCGYAVGWVAIKDRWGLSVDADEKAALMRVLGECG